MPMELKVQNVLASSPLAIASAAEPRYERKGQALDSGNGLTRAMVDTSTAQSSKLNTETTGAIAAQLLGVSTRRDVGQSSETQPGGVMVNSEAPLETQPPDPAVPEVQSNPLQGQESSPLEREPIHASPLTTFITRSSVGARLRDSNSAIHHFRTWVTFVTNHRNIIDARVKAEEMRKKFNDKRMNFKEAHDAFARLLRDSQSMPSDSKLPGRLLKQSYVVGNAQEQLEAAEEELAKIESELVKEESALLNLLPEILRNDTDPEEIFSILRKRGLDFQGDSSYLQESTAETSHHPVESEPDPEAQLITSKLEAIQLLEESILSLRERRTKIVQEALMNVAQDSNAREKTLDELDEYDARERSMTSDLKLALANLETLRKSEADFEKAEIGDVVFISKPATVDSDGKFSRSEGDSRENKTKSRQTATGNNASLLFAALRRLLRSQPMEEVTVFPSNLIDTSNGRADPFDLINSWLFYQLRTSDHELRIYVDCLMWRLDLSKSLSPKQIFDYALREWHKDITFKVPIHEQARNTTIRTNLGGSHFPFSNTASLNYQFGRAQNLVDRPPLTNPNQRIPRKSPLEDILQEHG